jgi:hypothetical protein
MFMPISSKGDCGPRPPSIEHQQNLTLVVQASAMTGAADHTGLQTFLNRTIRGRGKVTLYNGRKQVEVVRPEDIEVVER